MVENAASSSWSSSYSSSKSKSKSSSRSSSKKKISKSKSKSRNKSQYDSLSKSNSLSRSYSSSPSKSYRKSKSKLRKKSKSKPRNKSQYDSLSKSNSLSRSYSSSPSKSYSKSKSKPRKKSKSKPRNKSQYDSLSKSNSSSRSYSSSPSKSYSKSKSKSKSSYSSRSSSSTYKKPVIKFIPFPESKSKIRYSLEDGKLKWKSAQELEKDKNRRYQKESQGKRVTPTNYQKTSDTPSVNGPNHEKTGFLPQQQNGPDFLPQQQNGPGFLPQQQNGPGFLPQQQNGHIFYPTNDAKGIIPPGINIDININDCDCEQNQSHLVPKDCNNCNSCVQNQAQNVNINSTRKRRLERATNQRSLQTSNAPERVQKSLNKVREQYLNQESCFGHRLPLKISRKRPTTIKSIGRGKRISIFKDSGITVTNVIGKGIGRGKSSENREGPWRKIGSFGTKGNIKQTSKTPEIKLLPKPIEKSLPKSTKPLEKGLPKPPPNLSPQKCDINKENFCACGKNEEEVVRRLPQDPKITYCADGNCIGIGSGGCQKQGEKNEAEVVNILPKVLRTAKQLPREIEEPKVSRKFRFSDEIKEHIYANENLSGRNNQPKNILEAPPAIVPIGPSTSIRINTRLHKRTQAPAPAPQRYPFKETLQDKDFNPLKPQCPCTNGSMCCENLEEDAPTCGFPKEKSKSIVIVNNGDLCECEDKWSLIQRWQKKSRCREERQRRREAYKAQEEVRRKCWEQKQAERRHAEHLSYLKKLDCHKLRKQEQWRFDDQEREDKILQMEDVRWAEELCDRQDERRMFDDQERRREERLWREEQLRERHTSRMAIPELEELRRTLAPVSLDGQNEVFEYICCEPVIPPPPQQSSENGTEAVMKLEKEHGIHMQFMGDQAKKTCVQMRMAPPQVGTKVINILTGGRNGCGPGANANANQPIPPDIQNCMNKVREITNANRNTINNNNMNMGCYNNQQVWPNPYANFMSYPTWFGIGAGASCNPNIPNFGNANQLPFQNF